MKILWILNMVLPNVASTLKLRTSVSGGWLVDYANKLAHDKNIEIATMTYANVPNFMCADADGIKNYIFPGGGKRLLFSSKKTIADCKYVLKDFEPDIIHIHGTEYSIGASMIKTGTNIPIVLTIQGILSRISQEYYGGLSSATIFKMGKLSEWLRLKTTFFAKKLFEKNAKRERFVLNNVKYVTGRTTWDKSTMLAINNKLEYIRFNYNLRQEFYVNKVWDSNNHSKHIIYTGAASYPLKGLHVLIPALNIIKEKYPDVKLIIPGHNPMTSKPNGYERFILKMIKKYGLQSNVEYIGNIKAGQVVDKLLESSVCVVPSAVEGASATLCEAMKLGVPCVCSYRGGMTDLFIDGKSGFYYDFLEYPVLATRVMELFENKSLCEQFSNLSMEQANIRHERESNYKQLISIYNEVLGENKNEQ